MGAFHATTPQKKIRNAATFLRRPRPLWPVWLRQKRNSKRNGITNETWRIVVGVFRLVDFLSATHNPLKGIGYCEMLRRGGSFERAVGKLRSVDGSENITRLIMVQRILPRPMILLSAGVDELTLMDKTQMAIGIEAGCNSQCIGRHTTFQCHFDCLGSILSGL